MFFRSGGTNVGRLGALAALARDELDLLTLLKGAEPLRLDVGVVDEEILAPVIRRDESVALLLIKPLHRAFTQLLFSSGHTKAYVLDSPLP